MQNNNKNLYDLACEILKNNPQPGDFRTNAEKLFLQLSKTKKN
jgi:hypothetical protein